MKVTAQPSSAKRRTSSRPMPRLPPVTTTAFPASPGSSNISPSADDGVACVHSQGLAADRLGLGEAEEVDGVRDVFRAEEAARERTALELLLDAGPLRERL